MIRTIRALRRGFFGAVGVLGFCGLAIAQSASVDVDATGLPNPVTAGAVLTYNASVSNEGPDDAANAVLTITLPVGEGFNSITAAPGWACSTPAVGASGDIQCTQATLPPGSASFQVAVKTDATLADGSSLDGHFVVSSTTPDPGSSDNVADVITPVISRPAGAVTFGVAPDPVVPGSALTYTAVASNTGLSDGGATTLSLALPAEALFQSLTAPAAWACTTPAIGSSGPVDCSRAGFPPAVADTFTVNTTANPGAAGGLTLSAIATLTLAGPDQNLSNNVANADTVTAAPVSELTLTLADAPDPVVPGGVITYTATASNAGPSTAANAYLSSAIPANTVFASLTTPAGWSCTTPPVGGTGTVDCSQASWIAGSPSTFLIAVKVNPALSGGIVINAAATLTADCQDTNPADNSATATTLTSTPQADLEVALADVADPIAPGSNVGYVANVINHGPSQANAAQLDFALPANTTFVGYAMGGTWTCTAPPPHGTGSIHCSNPALAPGSADVLFVTLRSDPALPAGTVIPASLTVGSATADPSLANNTATTTHTTSAPSADLAVAISPLIAPPPPGAFLPYRIQVHQNGPSNASNVTLSILTPTNTLYLTSSAASPWTCTTPSANSAGTLSCTAATLAPGNTNLQLVVYTPSNTAPGTVLTATVSVTSATADPDASNNSATDKTTLSAAQADLITQVFPTQYPAAPGASIVAITHVDQAGPSDTTAVQASIAVPAPATFVSMPAVPGWTCTLPAVGTSGTVTCSTPSMTAGQGADLPVTMTTSPTLASGSSFTLSATVSSAATDPQPGNNSSTFEMPIGNPLVHFAITLADSVDPVVPGTTLTYFAGVTSQGPSQGTDVSFTFATPAHTTFAGFTPAAGWSCTTPAVGSTGSVSCTLPTLAPNAPTANFQMVVTVAADAVAGSVISAVATASNGGGGSGSDVATADTTVGAASADLAVTLADTPDPVNAGTPLSYAIHLSNAGISYAPNARWNLDLPAGTTFTSVSAPAGWACTAPAVGATGSVSCSLPSLALAAADFSVAVQVGAQVPANTTLTATVTAASDGTDPNAANSSATATTLVLSPAHLGASKSAPPVAPIGQGFTYTITLTNSGPSAQNDNPGDEFYDTLPAPLVPTDASASDGVATVDVPSRTVHWNGRIPANGSVTLLITASVPRTVSPGTVLSNQATVQFDADGDGSNESSALSDDPLTAAAFDATAVTARLPSPVPALGLPGIVLLAGCLLGLAWRRRRYSA